MINPNEQNSNIILKEGDILKSEMQTLVNTINCKGIMGGGLARQFRKELPAMYEDYRNRVKNKEISTGQPYLWENSSITDKKVLNFPTKYHWKNPSKMIWIEEGLQYFIQNYKSWKIGKCYEKRDSWSHD